MMKTGMLASFARFTPATRSFASTGLIRSASGCLVTASRTSVTCRFGSPLPSIISKTRPASAAFFLIPSTMATWYSNCSPKAIYSTVFPLGAAFGARRYTWNAEHSSEYWDSERQADVQGRRRVGPSIVIVIFFFAYISCSGGLFPLFYDSPVSLENFSIHR